MSRLAGSLLLVAASLIATSAQAADPANGRKVFERRCAECHAAGVGHPGAQMLGWTRGEDKALLENRKDLAPEYITHVVRHGLAAMPPLRPTEIDDAALADLVAYLVPAPPAGKAGAKR